MIDRKVISLDVYSVLTKENKIGERSEDNAGRMSASLIGSCKVFKTKK